MQKISCNIIQDLLPVYIDGVCCEDTRRLVEAHLGECEACRAQTEKFGQALRMPEEQAKDQREAKMIRSFKRKICIKRLLAVLLTAVIVAGGFYKIFVLGSLAVSDEVQLVSEILYQEGSYLNQAWVIHILDGDGNVVNCRTKYIEDGSGKITGCDIYVYTAPRIGGGNGIESFSWGYSVDEAPWALEQDFAVNIIFRDKQVSYSMREEGLYAPQDVEIPEGGLEGGPAGSPAE